MRERTGRGQQIDMALLDTMTGVLANQAMNYFASGVTPPRVGNAHLNVCALCGVSATADGWFILAVGNDGQFRRFCDVAGLEAECARPALRDQCRRGSTTASRCSPRSRRDQAVRARRPARPAGGGGRVRPGRSTPSPTLFDDPQFKARGLRIEPQGTPGRSQPDLTTVATARSRCTGRFADAR